MLFLPLFVLFFSFDHSFPCGFQDPRNVTSSEQIYTTVKRRRSGGVTPPPWKPISIYTEYNAGIQSQLGGNFNALKTVVSKAVDRLKGMTKVQSPGEINVDMKICQGLQGHKKFPSFDYAFFIHPKPCGGIEMAAARSCDMERLRADKATGMVYHSYDKEYNNANLQQFFGRPVAGKIEICLEKFKERKGPADDDLWLSTILHEMTHALAFSPLLFAHFLKRNGNSFQVYDNGQIGFPFPSNYQDIFEIPGVVKKVMRDWKTQGGMKKHPVHLLTTPEVTRQAREHFDCPTLEGGELENQGGQGSVMGHWEKRIYEDETMAAINSHGSAFSKITLALYADSGWYEVDYNKADPVAFGWKKGCKFATRSCGEWVDSNPSDSYPYCKTDELRCSEDHTRIEHCNAFAHPRYPSVPQTDDYRYFALEKTSMLSAKGFPMAFADYCPYYALLRMNDEQGKIREGKCTSAVSDRSEDQKMSLQMFSKTARCFQIKKLDENGFHVRFTTNSEIGERFVSHGCFEHKCEQGSVWVKRDKGEFIRCSKEGEEVKVKTAIEGGKTVEFSIICPGFKKMCEERDKTKKKPNAPETVGGNGDEEAVAEPYQDSSTATTLAVLSSFVMMLLL